MTIKQAAEQAIDVQDACNLSGVLRSFVLVIDALRANGVAGTDAIATHPVSVLFADKIRSLTGDDFSTAYHACKVLADRT